MTLTCTKTVTVFAYGVTSSGKTHTMQGSREDPGIIPQAVEALFEKQSGLERYGAELAVSYMEIYKDEVYDLLTQRDNVSQAVSSSLLPTIKRPPNYPFVKIQLAKSLLQISVLGRSPTSTILRPFIRQLLCISNFRVLTIPVRRPNVAPWRPPSSIGYPLGHMPY